MMAPRTTTMPAHRTPCADATTPTSATAPPANYMRPCGCDWDTRVFGHAYCWNSQATTQYPKHVTCRCTTCPCTCHDPTS